MTWLRRQANETQTHRCTPPVRDAFPKFQPPDWALRDDLWQCDTCDKVWRVGRDCDWCDQGHRYHGGQCSVLNKWRPSSWSQARRYRRTLR